ncbi:hypothetical protein [Dactylosporangium matsuzakiense]|uniref:hypothetical protein n=1 Tax=Dactylosporangium matsuzakiense TaxID=53360 RepID=UPI0021C27BA0|nr:hypothetical protein [Dactylosporangium matsuzakiense]UWZ48347.1 hypothetical protein Dmats_19215 [Dactylosporangium matsuzakiense]
MSAVNQEVSFAALLTDSHVDNGAQLPLWERLPPAVYWPLPGDVAAALLRRALHRFAAGFSSRPAWSRVTRRQAGAAAVSRTFRER